MPAFQHEALFYEGCEGFLTGVLPFIRDGLDRGEPILVAVDAPKIERLRARLGSGADSVHFADMSELGRNPGRIIPAWHAFLDRHGRPGHGIRGIGEPICAERGAEELVECQLHEALLNVAFADADNFHLLCPYDTASLSEDVLHEACCSHPAVVQDGAHRASAAYRGTDDPLSPFEAPLPRPPATAETLGFERGSLSEVRRLLGERGERAGLPPADAQDLVLAVNELATNSVRHGGGHGILRLWRDDGALHCEVRDRGRIDDPLVGRRPVGNAIGGWGVWIAHQVSDLVQVRSGPDGTVVRLRMRVARGSR